MKTRLLTIAAFALILCSCGTSQKATTVPPENAIKPVTDALVVELDFFEGRSLGSDRSYMIVYGDKIQGRVGIANGMTRPGVFITANDALKLDRCDARISEPKVSSDGRRYSFVARVDDAKFLNSFRKSDWRLTFTVYDNGSVLLDIESEAISTVNNSRLWHINGHVNKERTEALQLIKASDSAYNWAE